MHEDQQPGLSPCRQENPAARLAPGTHLLLAPSGVNPVPQPLQKAFTPPGDTWPVGQGVQSYPDATPKPTAQLGTK